MVLEQLLLVTVGMADTVMVSTVGEAAVSGISLVDQVNVLLIQIFAALATGGAVVASQYLGRRFFVLAKNYDPVVGSVFCISGDSVCKSRYK